VYCELETAQERLIQVGSQIGRQDGNAIIGLHTLEQIADLQISVAVMGILDPRPFTEDSVGLIKKEDRVATLRLAKDSLQILLRLPNVLTDQAGKVNLIEVQSQVACDHLSGHGLAGAGWAGEQHRYRRAGCQLLPQPPFLQHS